MACSLASAGLMCQHDKLTSYIHVMWLDAAGVSVPVCIVLLLFPFCSLLLPMASLLSCSPFSLACPAKKRNKTCSNTGASSCQHTQHSVLNLLQLQHGETNIKQRPRLAFKQHHRAMLQHGETNIKQRPRLACKQHHRAMEQILTTIATHPFKNSYNTIAADCVLLCTRCATNSGAGTSNIGHCQKPKLAKDATPKHPAGEHLLRAVMEVPLLATAALALSSSCSNVEGSSIG